MSDSLDNGGFGGGAADFGGDTFGNGGMAGIGGGNVNGSDGLSAGSGGNGGDPSGGYLSSAADFGAIAAVGAAGAIGGAPGALMGTFGLGLFGLSPQQAAVNLMHDMSLSLGTNLAANPSQLAGLFATEAISYAGTPGIDPAAGSIGFYYDQGSFGGSA